MVEVMKLALIGDDQKSVRIVRFCLQVRYQDIVVLGWETSRGVPELLADVLPDMVVLDISIPGTRVIDLIGGIRRFSDVPLLVLGNDETDIDRARGLEAGADDYMVRPFSPIELLARCNALLRRAKQPVAGAPAVSFGHLTIDLGTRQVSIDGEPVALTPIEYRLLGELAQNGGLTVSNDDLLEKVWGVEYRSDLSLVKTYVYRLRTKLRAYMATI